MLVGANDLDYYKVWCEIGMVEILAANAEMAAYAYADGHLGDGQADGFYSKPYVISVERPDRTIVRYTASIEMVPTVKLEMKT